MSRLKSTEHHHSLLCLYERRKGYLEIKPRKHASSRHLCCVMERSVILLSNCDTSMCGNNAEAPLDKCVYMQVFIKHSAHLNNERTVHLKLPS